jgi:hypothetical protein
MKFAILAIRELDKGLILTPERYANRTPTTTEGVTLSDLVRSVRETISPANTRQSGPLLVLDTSHARHGILDSEEALVANQSLGSTKKLVEAGDVLISRLRHYLRQVAYVDGGAAMTRQICASTEFYVLRGVERKSIAFLVPWLLSDRVQQVLANSQEGGHHPRFHQDVLLQLKVPNSVMAQRDQLSERIESASAAYRDCRSLLAGAADLVAHATHPAARLDNRIPGVQ